jgi:hypothetical protein
LAKEQRFASSVSKHLPTSDALTQGARRAIVYRDLAQFDIDNNYGRAALEAIMKAIMGLEGPLISPPSDYKGKFFDCINFSYLR